MDPLTTATGLGSIIGLIGQFISGRDSAKSHDYAEFMQWIQEHQHDEIKRLIEADHATTVSIKAILNRNHAQLAESLAQINVSLAGMASVFTGFSDLAKSLNYKDALSNQTLSLLEYCAAIDDGRLNVFRAIAGPQLRTSNEVKGARFHCEDKRFIEDDLAQLVAHELLIKSGEASTSEYTITRKGVDLVRQLKVARAS